MKVELLSITPDAEKLIEKAGRTSHLSFEQQREDTEKKFVKMIIDLKHDSVLEHAYATFRISGVSRALTHQLVRHRLCSYTQQSQRYVSESNFNYVEPDRIKKNIPAHNLFTDFMRNVKETYRRLQELGIENEDARFVLPNAVCSEIVVTANLREWRHILKSRGAESAQWEIREMAIQILKILKEKVSTVFYDYEIDDEDNTIRCRQ